MAGPPRAADLENVREVAAVGNLQHRPHGPELVVRDCQLLEACAPQEEAAPVDVLRAPGERYLAFLYEVRVKTSTAESDRHRARSMNFFYAMLAAQIGATISSLGLARRQKSLLWAVAGVAGVIAVTFGAYVYLSM